MKPVKSDSITAIGHDPMKKVLSVQFSNGKTYDYAGVSAEHHAALMGADSIGRHFMKHIRGTFKGVAK